MSAVLRRKNVKKGVSFSLMVVGASGLGKSTLVNTICEQVIIPQRPLVSAAETALPKTIRIQPYTVEMDEEGAKITLTVVDTPGFGDNIDNSDNFAAILKYIESQYDDVLLEETRIKRNPKFHDNRIDLLIYFIPPTGQGLKQLDIEFMRKLGTRVNVLPVIAKSDSLLPQELANFKKRVKMDIETLRIPVFAFPYDPEEDDDETIAENSELRDMLPFTVIGVEDTYTVNGRHVRGRQYPWGVCETDNLKHCDFSRLRYIILSSHLQDLKDLTHDLMYETYRTEKLQREEGRLSPAHSREMSNQELRDQVAQHVMLKEDILRREEEKLREMELKVQREIEAKRRELLVREQSLKEMEQRASSDSGH